MIGSNYKKIKADLLNFGRMHRASPEEYRRLYKAKSIEEVIAVVKDNFWWWALYRDFVDVIMANREQFAEHQIWINQDVVIHEGSGCMLASEGIFSVRCNAGSSLYVISKEHSMLSATSDKSSKLYAASYDFSTIFAESYCSSVLEARSDNFSTLVVISKDSSTINAKSHALSTIYAESLASSTIHAESWRGSTIHVKSYHTSTVKALSNDASTISAKSMDTSTINVISNGGSTIDVESCGSSTINATSRDTSTMIIRTPIIECKVKDKSIARYVYENRIVVADDSIKVEKANNTQEEFNQN